MGDETTEGISRLKKIFIIVIACVVALVALVVVLCVTLTPSKPIFNLQDITVYTFNVSTAPPYTLTVNMQVTLSSKNPNSMYGIAYQSGTDLYAEYRGQRITYASLLPGTYQGHKEIVVWSPFLKGEAVPISPYNGESLAQDLNVGVVMINIKLAGKLKWKYLPSSKHQLNVACPANIRFGDLIINGGVAIGPAVIKGQPMDRCSVGTV